MVKLAVFSTKPYDKHYLSAAVEALQSNKSAPSIEITFLEAALNLDHVALAHGADCVCVFVNDSMSAEVLEALSREGVKGILLRCAGFNNIDLAAADELGLFVANVPSYSPEAVGEFAVALVQTLNRHTHRAYNRVREGNFSLTGLLGKTLHGKTVGIIGSGKIGVSFARIMKGFGCKLLAYDPYPADAFRELGEFVDLDTLLPQCDVVSLHCPLFPATRHIINERTLAAMKPGAMLINTSRGGLIDTRAVIQALKSGHLGGCALDVYEGEGGLFYSDHSGDIIQDDELMRLMTFPNVICTGHQAFFTEEALREISDCTLANLVAFAAGEECKNALSYQGHRLNGIPNRT